MFKTLVTLFRARTFVAEETFSDAHALTLLDQQIRDCGAALTRAKKAMALAAAQHQAETRRLATLEAHIAELDSRACAALKQGRDDLALETAGLLADLEADRDAAGRACELTERECEKMRARLRKSEARLAELNRGRALVRAKESLGQLRRDAQADNVFRAGFEEAEATLARLTQRQQLADDAEQALAGFEHERSPEKMTEKLAEAGCGRRLRASAEEVFARLREKNAAMSAA
ncbi:phage shock protein A [Rhodoblastus acidophilus]|uniref:PspA/IM30 family protein n=1 Tax=Rhodoblastus acidophilus TaxID=1074 RepID=UPI0022258D77|nr:PspA/IM30 family protein [Rhodoblastus acidophilus]MCW2285040.1 phage shock protein A [Rhodoblastus acidophilus]MCW2333896.1 phage shock protein A [Rhodoblastus acidophilus]